ncbi:hypothetical protein [Celeribacter arenosi]|uniref:Permease n=1 Tax=Celeribacter arenosi TaxID=792649 RepID=A0ABP7KEQ0_9RHOB
MEQISSVGDGNMLDDLLQVASERVRGAIMDVDEAIRAMRDQKDDGAGVAKRLSELNKAIDNAFTERKKLDEQSRKQGGLAAGDIDFDAARSEILDCLDRVRTSRGAGSVPE